MVFGGCLRVGWRRSLLPSSTHHLPPSCTLTLEGVWGPRAGQVGSVEHPSVPRAACVCSSVPRAAASLPAPAWGCPAIRAVLTRASGACNQWIVSLMDPEFSHE